MMNSVALKLNSIHLVIQNPSFQFANACGYLLYDDCNILATACASTGKDYWKRKKKDYNSLSGIMVVVLDN
eukprot:11522254-Ditylum_brightwellii.AAC.1